MSRGGGEGLPVSTRKCVLRVSRGKLGTRRVSQTRNDCELNSDPIDDLCSSRTKCHGTDATKPIHGYCGIYLLVLDLQGDYHDPGWTVRQQQLVLDPSRQRRMAEDATVNEGDSHVLTSGRR